MHNCTNRRQKVSTEKKKKDNLKVAHLYFIWGVGVLPEGYSLGNSLSAQRNCS